MRHVVLGSNRLGLASSNRCCICSIHVSEKDRGKLRMSKTSEFMFRHSTQVASVTSILPYLCMYRYFEILRHPFNKESLSMTRRLTCAWIQSKLQSGNPSARHPGISQTPRRLNKSRVRKRFSRCYCSAYQLLLLAVLGSREKHTKSLELA